MKKLLIASVLAALGAAVIHPVVSSDDAFAGKQEEDEDGKPMKKKPTGKM